MRTRRRELTSAEQQRAAESLARALLCHPLLWRARRIALYLAQDGEIDPLPLLHSAIDLGKMCYLPRIRPNHGQRVRNQLWFLRYRPGDPLEPNRYGILEPCPDVGKRAPAAVLDLVLLPLVAFDRAGNRLGMGAGYYDQTFAFTRAPNRWRRPRLIGLAHASQLVEELPRKPWDIPLDGVATDREIHLFDTRRGGSAPAEREAAMSGRKPAGAR